eukprot:707-Eustigmatos_ZCMA.PRE.1
MLQLEREDWGIQPVCMCIGREHAKQKTPKEDDEVQTHLVLRVLITARTPGMAKWSSKHWGMLRAMIDTVTPA